jgi:LysM repeat protein
MIHWMKFQNLLVGLVIYLSLTPGISTAAPLSQEETEPVLYFVQPQDTLAQIALKYNLSLADLILTNHLTNPNLIFPGQQLLLPGVMMPAPPTVTPGSEVITPEAEQSNTPQTHIVQAGETLFSIAGRYNVSMGAIIPMSWLTPT